MVIAMTCREETDYKKKISLLKRQQNQVIEANRKLVDDKNEVIKDIKVLIAFLRGNNTLKEQVNEIIEYYSKRFNTGL